MKFTDSKSTGRQKLTKAFSLLRQQGILARQDYLCCMSCGCAGMEDTAKKKSLKNKKWPAGYAFYHRQDTEGLEESGTVSIRYGSFYDNKDKLRNGSFPALNIGYTIVGVMNSVGLKTSWDGDTGRVIEVDVENVGFEPESEN